MNSKGHFRTVLLFAILLSVTPSSATMVRVDPGGGGDVLSITAAMSVASAGDTVAVIQGTVSASNVQLVEGVQLLGGWDATFTSRIPGTTHLAGGPDNVLRCTLGQTTATLIDGFEITGAGNSAIYLLSSAATITHNEIHDNDGQDGAGIHCEFGASPLIEENHLHHNSATYGGAIRAHWGVDTSPTIRNNLIEYNSALQAGGGIGVNNGSPLIEGNTIRFNSTEISGGNTGGGIHVWHGEGGVVTVRENLIIYNTADEGGGIGINGGHPVIERNTLWGNGASEFGGTIFQATSIYFDPGTTQLVNNIIGGTTSRPAVECYDDFAISIDCNCLSGNADGNFQNCPSSSNDLLQNPMFCNLAGEDFTLHAGSPCAGPGPLGCGPIGAFGVACGPIPVETASWAQIKSLYR